MKTLNPTFLLWTTLALSSFSLDINAQAMDFASDDPLTRTHFSVNFQNADITSLLALVAAQTGLTLKADKDLSGTVSMNLSSVTGKEILDKLSQEQPIDYSVAGNELLVNKRGVGILGSNGTVHHISLKYADAKETISKVMPLIPATDKLIADEHENAIILVGTNESWRKISEVIQFLDVAESQILIEAQILETSSQFLRDVGVSLGFTSASGNHTVSTSNPIPDTANLSYSGVFSGALGSALGVQIAAAETNGNAKIVSRPKVLTLNNQKAKIESGVTINVKTLSTAISNPSVSAGSTSTGVAGLAATTGITTINAGLTLDILPTIVGKDMIKLAVNINNSSPDTADEVDGIPAVSNNAASTSIIVKSGETAIIAGLVKQSKSNTSTGVPFLSSIPLIGGLFGSSSRNDTNNELVIFITPTIDGGHIKVATADSSQPAPEKAITQP